MISISGRIKPSVKASLPSEARAPTAKAKSKMSASHSSRRSKLDDELDEINSRRSEARFSAQVPPMHFDRERAEFDYMTKSPSVMDSWIKQSKSAAQEQEEGKQAFQVPRSTKVEKTKGIDLNQDLSPKDSTSKKSNLGQAAIYKIDKPRPATAQNKVNFLEQPATTKKVSGIDSIASEFKAQPQSTLKVATPTSQPSNLKKQEYPGQFYADERLKRLRHEFLKKDIPVIDDRDFMRKEQTTGEEVLEQNLEAIFKQHDEDRAGDHGPCYLPGQLLEKFPFSKQGMLKRDHKPLDFNEAKPIFGDANVPKEAFRPHLPQDHSTTYRVDHGH